MLSWLGGVRILNCRPPGRARRLGTPICSHFLAAEKSTTKTTSSKTLPNHTSRSQERPRMPFGSILGAIVALILVIVYDIFSNGSFLKKTHHVYTPAPFSRFRLLKSRPVWALISVPFSPPFPFLSRTSIWSHLCRFGTPKL